MEPPTFVNCPTEALELDYLEPAVFTPPESLDNSGAVKAVVVDKEFMPGDLVTDSLSITYSVTDYSGITDTCQINIVRKGMNICVYIYHMMLLLFSG